MHSNLIFRDSLFRQVEKIPTEWLYDYAPNNISWKSKYYTKDILTTKELSAYSDEIKDFIKGLELKYPTFPSDELNKVVLELSEDNIKYHEIIGRVIKAVEINSELMYLDNDLYELSEMLIEKDEMSSGSADIALSKLWEFHESLEAGLEMISEDGERKVHKDIYDIIVNFINILDNAVNNGWNAEWSI